MNKKLFVSLISIFIFLPLFFILISSMSAQTDLPLRSSDLIVELYEGDPMSRYIGVPSPSLKASPRPQSPASFSPSWSVIAYESFVHNNWDVYTIGPSDAAPKRITAGNSVDVNPSVKNGLSQILFSSNRSGNFEIFVADANGANLQNLTNSSANDTSPMWSPDGTQILFQSDWYGQVDIFVMNADGSNLKRLTTSGAYDGMANWSHDSSQIVFSSNRNGIYQIWVMDVDGSNQRLLSDVRPAYFPAWSPDGKRIAFSTDSNQDGFLELWMMDADGTNPRRISYYVGPSDQGIDAWMPTWSPDGNSILFTRTAWTNIDGKWYWYSSIAYQIPSGEWGLPVDAFQLNTDDRIWKTHWSSLDGTPPGLCTVSVEPQSRSTAVTLSLSATDSTSGIYAYEVQARSTGGEWRTILSKTNSSGIVYYGQDNEVVEFRCRATDWSGNRRNWTNAPVTQTVIDASLPQSKILVDRFVRGNQASVSWSGIDGGSGVISYDVSVKRDGEPNWSLWQDDTVNTTAVYTGTIGSTYYFRSQATDGVGHVEVWQPSPEATVTFYAQVISGTLTDNRGMPIVATPVLTPTGGVDASIGSYRAYTSNALTHTLSLSASGYETFPPTDFSTTSDTQFDVVLGPSTNVLVNGGMESGDLTGWAVSGSGVSTVSTPYSGGYGMQLSGVTAVSQTVSVPNTMNQPTLSFMYQLPSDLSSGNLRVQVSGTTTTTVLNTAVATPDWTHVWADLSPYAGQTITLSVSLDAPTGTAVLDAFSIGPWETPIIYAVSPEEVQPGGTITVTGDNFISTPSLFINDLEVGSVQWISPTQITAVLPNAIDLDTYDVKVINPSGSATWMTNALTVTQPTVMLPVILKNSSGIAISDFPQDSSNWLTLGYDVAHTGYHQTDLGGSNYTLVWTTTLPIEDPLYFRKQVAVADGVLVATNFSYGSNSKALVIALDAYTGDEIWRYTDTGTSGIAAFSAPTIANGSVYFQYKEFYGGAYLNSLNLYSGGKYLQFPYSTNYPINYFHPLVVNDKVFFLDHTSGLYAIDAQSGEELFSSPQTYSTEVFLPAYARGQFYLCYGEVFKALDSDTGDVLWSINMGGFVGTNTLLCVPVVAKNIALVSKYSKLIAINLNTHEIVWSVWEHGRYHGTFPAVADDIVYAIGNGELEARRLSDGALLWSFAGDSALTNAPIVAGDYVYVASNANTYVLNRHTHQLVWTTAQGGWLSLANGYLYIAQLDNTIYAYRAESE